jgi:hypothetical protein
VGRNDGILVGLQVVVGLKVIEGANGAFVATVGQLDGREELGEEDGWVVGRAVGRVIGCLDG